jgi:hypothetical protein
MDNTTGIEIRWGLMAGSTFQQTAGSWSTGNVVGSSSQFNFMGTSGNVFELFDVGLYQGSVAPSYIVPDYADELTRCMRYFQQPIDATGQYFAPLYGYTGTTLLGVYQYQVPMRAAPVLIRWTRASECVVPSG